MVIINFHFSSLFIIIFEMVNFFLIFLILFGLSGCITIEEKSFVFKEVNNNETKIGLSQNKFKNSVEEYKFIQWKCYKYHLLIST